MLEPHNPRLSISRSCIIEAHGGARACILDLAMHYEGDVLHVTTSQSVALGRLDTDTGAVLGGEAAAATLERASQLAAGE